MKVTAFAIEKEVLPELVSNVIVSMINSSNFQTKEAQEFKELLEDMLAAFTPQVAAVVATAIVYAVTNFDRIPKTKIECELAQDERMINPKIISEIFQYIS